MNSSTGQPWVKPGDDNVGEGAPRIVRIRCELIALDTSRRAASEDSPALCEFEGYAACGTETPTMLSRVTRPASRSSLQPSVPGGRSGSTR